MRCAARSREPLHCSPGGFLIFGGGTRTNSGIHERYLSTFIDAFDDDLGLSAIFHLDLPRLESGFRLGIDNLLALSIKETLRRKIQNIVQFVSVYDDEGGDSRLQISHGLIENEAGVKHLGRLIA